MSSETPLAAVVVGVDGSVESLAAVTFAAHEAQLRGTDLHIVHAFIWPLMHVPLEAAPSAPPGAGLREQGDRYLADAAALVQDQVPVSTELVVGGAGSVLVRASHEAALVVIGNRGLGGFTGLLAGSVSVQVAEHARCPVTIVRDGARLGAPESGDVPVVVGVDDSDNCEPALGFAFAEAELRTSPLLALHAWTHPRAEYPGDIQLPVHDVELGIKQASDMLDARLEDWRARYPHVVVRREIAHRPARAALIEASGNACLTVVGSRGRGGFTGLLLGSVSQALIHHARSPITVVRSKS